MAECLLLKGGGGATTSDELNATRANVEVGKTAVTKDSDDEAATGTLRNITKDTTIDHASNNSTPVVVGDQAYISTNTDGVTRAEIRFNGTRGVLEQNTLIGIPQGTMASAGGLIASKLMKNQSAFGIFGTATSDATATAAYIRSGYTAYVNGSKITGSMSVSSLVSFSVATYSTTQVTATWRWPSKGPYSGIAICGKTGSYPSNINDSRLYTGHGSNYNLGATTSAVIGGLSPGQTYYFRVWVYCNTSAGDIYSNYSQATAATKPQGQQIFTSSSTFTVPANVTSIDIFCVGGGGSGTSGNGSSSRSNIHSGGGGGGGYTTTQKGYSVSPGQQLAITVGAGGTGSSMGNSGSASSVGSVSAAGGNKAASQQPSGQGSGKYGGSGGSAGGGGWTWNGASNGGDTYVYSSYGKGQGSTTRAFGDSSGTLYAGGGGSGGCNYDDEFGNEPGTGGSGGGATTSAVRGANGTNASANTGGGGSGGWGYFDGHTSYSGSVGGSGGSGIVIIRWGY